MNYTVKFIIILKNSEQEASMTEVKAREGEFDEIPVGDMCEELMRHFFVLKALGELIASSCLISFCDDTGGEIDGANLRRGIQQIIDLYLYRQEKIILKYREKQGARS